MGIVDPSPCDVHRVVHTGPALLGWLLQQRAARHLTMDLLRASEGLLRATAVDPPLQREVWHHTADFLLQSFFILS